MSDQAVGLITASATAPTRNNLLAPRGHLIDYGNVQVSIYCERQCAWNRRGSHDKHMWMITLLPQNISLFYPEAMLLIDDYQP